MRNFDLTPFWRSTVGFDRVFDLIDNSLRLTGENNYPPYNIERTGEENYRISLALAGFMPEEVTVTVEQNMLTVEGRKAEKVIPSTSIRGFPRVRSGVINLADHVEVKRASFRTGYWRSIWSARCRRL